MEQWCVTQKTILEMASCGMPYARICRAGLDVTQLSYIATASVVSTAYRVRARNPLTSFTVLPFLLYSTLLYISLALHPRQLTDH